MNYNEAETTCRDECGIYKITNNINGHCYIGQTSRQFKIRWKEHYQASRYNKGGENHTPLHKAIKKYGIDNFDFTVIELCDKDKLDDREKYWISVFQSNSHDNYNQTSGGNNENLKMIQPEYVAKVIDLLETTNLTQIEIASICECSDDTVSNINCGTRHRIDGLTYPIRKTTIDNKVIEIAKELSNKSLTFQELADKYGVSLSTVKRINKGEGRYHLDEYVYPIYDFKNKSENFIDDLIYDLIYGSLSQVELAKKYNISYGTVNKTNKGEINRREDLDYPLRKK